MTDEVGEVYTLHFSRRIGGPGRNGAQHYVGYARSALARFRSHQSGTSGVPIIRYAVTHGVTLTLVDVRPGTRKDERRLKNSGHHERRCPLCHQGLT